MQDFLAAFLLLVGLLVYAPAVSAQETNDNEHMHIFYDEYSHVCVRNCTADPRPRVCSYSFNLEWFMTMSRACYDCPKNLTDCYRPHCITGDGTKRALLSVNRQLSGPGIHVCEGDTVAVTVSNMMEMGEGATVHWHGIHHFGTQHMDGVPMLTQCPINAFSSFTYRFTASPAGTHFWHSHSGLQRSEGLFGPLVVRQASDPHAALYDKDQPEHTLLLTDWFHELTANKFANHHYSTGDNKPKGLIINGRGAFSPVSNGTYTPRYVLKVQQGRRHRIRLISSAILNCPFVISVANHTMLVIASDGAPFQPVEVDSLVMSAGERFDFVLNANRTPGNYLLMVAGLADCDARFTSNRQSALVSYEGVDELPLQRTANPSYTDMLPTVGRQLNPFNRQPDADNIAVTSLRALASNQDPMTPIDATADVKFYLAFDFEIVNNTRYHNPAYYPISISAVRKSTDGVQYTPQINNLAMHMPNAPPLYQMDDIPQSLICNNTEFNRLYETTYKACIHALRIKMNQVVELILIDKGVRFNASHPFHLHGQYFRVIGMEKMGSSVTVEEVKAHDASGRLQRNLDRPVIKDTVVVPDGGYVVLRFRATNPGPWMLHCHLEFHVESGMGLILMVGDPADWASRVPENFPRCGNWSAAGPGPWSEREKTLTHAFRMQLLGLGLGALAALVIAVLVSVFVTRCVMFRRNTDNVYATRDAREFAKHMEMSPS